MSLDEPVRLLDLLDPENLSDLCGHFAALFNLSLRVYDERGAQVAEANLDGDLLQWIFQQREHRGPFTHFVSSLISRPLDPDQPSVHRDPLFGMCWLVQPIVHEFEVLGRLVCGPYLDPEAPALPPLPAASGPPPPALQARWAQLMRSGEAGLRQKLALLLSALDAQCHAGLKVLLTGRIHLSSLTRAYAELKLTHERLAEAHSELQAQNARLRELDDIKSNFIATISHELRTPLTAVIGYGEMLLEELAGPINDEQREYVQHIVARGGDLLTLIGGLLDLARIEQGAAPLQRAACDIAQVVAEALASVAPQAAQAQVQLSAPIPPLPRLSLDAQKLRQILINLLNNAVKFTPIGGRVWLEATLGRHAEVDIEPALVISVHDTGIGVPAEAQAQLFEPFFQADNSSTRSFGGTGLGLSIVKEYVQLHGGAVLFEAHPAGGSIFTLVLPALLPQG